MTREQWLIQVIKGGEMLNAERLNQIEKIKLRHGAGENLDDGLCVMQAVDYITSGGFSDHPECSCPALTRFAIRLNDRMDDESRQRLKSLIPKLIGTRDGLTKERADFLVFHSITSILPILTDALNMTKDSEKLRSFKLGQWVEMRKFCHKLMPRIRAALKATTHAAADAAAYAATYAAHAADVADAAAYAADAATYAASAATYAASAADDANAADKRAFWLSVRAKIWEAAIKRLSKACDIRKEGAGPELTEKLKTVSKNEE